MTTSAAKFLPLIYDTLASLATNMLKQQPPDFTPRPTDLVHQALLKVCQVGGVDFQSDKHLYCVAARAVRQVLIDHARRRQRQRGVLAMRVEFDQIDNLAMRRSVDLLQFSGLLDELARIDPRRADSVELRYFGGLQVEEIARLQGVSKSTVERNLRAGVAWLKLGMRDD